jgi:hypothetical protein
MIRRAILKLAAMMLAAKKGSNAPNSHNSKQLTRKPSVYGGLFLFRLQSKKATGEISLIGFYSL